MSAPKVSNYQDFGRGGRNCELRYQVIKQHLPNERPLAVLDVGSNMGYFSISIARDFPSLVYSVEHRKEDYHFHIQQIRQAGLGNNYVFQCLLNKEIVAKIFRRLEVFDVTLLLSVVHHFHYPFREWCEMVGAFVRASALTFIEFPSMEDAADIAAIDKFRSWYSRLGSNPYEALLTEVLQATKLEHCALTTIRGSVTGDSTKETRHIIKVANRAVSASAPRFHCLSLAANAGMFLVHPKHECWGHKRQDLIFWCSRLPLRFANRLRRIVPSICCLSYRAWSRRSQREVS